jgi:hypothetical protein
VCERGENCASRLVRTRWSRKSRIEYLKFLRCERERKRHSVLLNVCWRAGFGNCDNVTAAGSPGQRDRGRRATARGTDLRERAVGYQPAILATEWRIRHDWHIMLRAPSQKVTLYSSVVEAVGNLIGRTAIAVGDTEEIFHLVNVKVRDPPSFDFPRRA